MKLYLLDTNVISELRKPKPHGAVAAWARTLQTEQLLLSALTMAELQIGIERTRQSDAGKALEIESWADALEATYRILPMDAACFREWARLMVRKPDDLYEDAMLAATANVHGLTVATRNERGFARLGVTVFNPFR